MSQTCHLNIGTILFALEFSAMIVLDVTLGDRCVKEACKHIEQVEKRGLR